MKFKEAYREELVSVLRKVAREDARHFEALMVDLLTPREFKTFAVRWQIMKLIAKGKKHRDIANALGVGIATVTRGSREFADKNGAFWRLLSGE